jgi:type I restriction enzyme S subunit
VGQNELGVVDGDADWYGDLPKGWSIERADTRLRRVREMVSPSDLGEVAFHYSIPELQETGDGAEARAVDIGSDKILLKGGELLVARLNPRKGLVLLAEAHDIPTVCSSEFVVMVPESCEPRFAKYLYLSHPVRAQIESAVQSVTRSHQRARPALISKLRLPWPPLRLQMSIADFLDKVTVRIARLVAAEQGLLRLINESYASEYVDRANGLTKEAPLVPLKRLGWFGSGTGFPDDEQGLADEEIPFLKVSDLPSDGSHRPVMSAANSISRETAGRLGATIFPAGTVVFPKIGAALMMNKRALLGVPSCIDNNMAGFVPHLLLPSYAQVALSLVDARQFAQPGAVPTIDMPSLRALKVRKPTSAQQEQVASEVNELTEQWRSLADQVGAVISRLNEQGASLISAAVTARVGPGVEAA